MNFISRFLFSFLIMMTSLNAKSFTFSGKLSNWQEFTITSNLSAFQLIVESNEQESEDLFIADLIDPSGKIIIKNNINSPSSYRVPSKLFSTLRNEIRPTYVMPGLFSVIIDKELLKGKWKFRLGKKTVSSSIRTFWHISKSYPTLVQRPTLELDVLISTSFKQVSQEMFNETLLNVQELYDSYGIQINFKNPQDWQDPLEENSDLEQKLKVVTPIKRQNPTLYLVNRLNSTVEKDFQGLAGCLPGFQVQYINAHCALLVSITDKPQHSFNISKLTKVVSHEIAHLLGLFHLEDDFYPFGRLLDPFDDTSLEKDLINVMHKTSEFFGLLEFSQSQVRKMRSQPILYQQ